MTGFKVNGQYLITDDNLFKISKAFKVKIVFVNSDGYSEKASIEISMDELNRRVIREVDKGETAFAVIKIDFKEFDEFIYTNIP